jgi:hypothetical protein
VAECSAQPAQVQKTTFSDDRQHLRHDQIRLFVEYLVASGKIRSNVKGRPVKADHISVDDMERYHQGQVHGYELARVEEHLLWCQHCLDRMEATERFIDMVRRGIVRGGFDLELEAWPD